MRGFVLQMGKLKPRRWNASSKGFEHEYWWVELEAGLLMPWLPVWWTFDRTMWRPQGCSHGQLKMVDWKIKKVKSSLVLQINQPRDACWTWCQVLRSGGHLLEERGAKWHKGPTIKLGKQDIFWNRYIRIYSSIIYISMDLTCIKVSNTGGKRWH